MRIRRLILEYLLFPAMIMYCNACIASVQVSSTQVCFGDTTTLYNLSNIPHTALVQWDLNDAGFYNSATGDTVRFVFPNPGDLSVNIKITDSAGNEYYNASPLVITVYALPQVNFTYSGICGGQTTILTNLSSISGSDTLDYAWDFNNTGITSSTSKNASVTYPGPGNYLCALKAISNHNCSSTRIRSVNIATRPAANFVYSGNCQSSSVVIVNNSSLYGDSLVQSIWTLGDGHLSFNSDTVLHTYTSDSVYSVNLVVRNSHGCADTISQNITIQPGVTTSLSYTPDSIIYPGYSASINVVGNFSNIIWNDGTTQNPKVVTDSGFYQYTATNQWGCSQSQVAHIQQTSSVASIEKANDIITPNGDGINDALNFKNLENFKTCKIKIYNLAGLEVYSSDNYKNDWNAVGNGKPVNDGTYYYVISCDDQYKLTGNTNVIR